MIFLAATKLLRGTDVMKFEILGIIGSVKGRALIAGAFPYTAIN